MNNHFLGVLQLAEQLSPLDVFLGLMAAAAHDVDHPGVNQPFLIKTHHHLASLYQVHAGVPTRVTVCGSTCSHPVAVLTACRKSGRIRSDVNLRI